MPNRPIAHPRLRRGRAATVVLGVLALLTVPLGARNERLEPALDGFFADWLASVEHLIDDGDRALFASLAGDELARELFIRRFWAARTALPPEPDRGPLARWRENREEVERRFGGMVDDRARALMIAGKPPRLARVLCDGVLRRLEIWSYDGWHAAFQAGAGETPGDGFLLLFFQERRLDDTSFVHWDPAEGTAPLMVGGPGRVAAPAADLLARARADGCLRRSATAHTLEDALEDALAGALGPAALRARIPPPAADPSWREAFAAELASDPRAARDALPAAPLELRYPGYYNDQRTILEGRVAIPADDLERTLEGQLFDRVRIVGDVRRERTVVDVFAVEHDLAGAVPADGTVRLAFYRRLRPGAYRLRVRVEDAYGLPLLRATRDLEVPRLETAAEAPASSRKGFVHLTRDEVTVLDTFPSVELLSPGPDHQVGAVELAAVTTGGPIERLVFSLDGRTAGEDDTPPYAVTLDLGDRPDRHTVEAVAFGPGGGAIARDSLLLNATPPRFAVRLVEPVAGSAALRAAVEVDVPEGEALDRVEIFVNRARVATLRQPPFAVALPAPAARGTTYVRAVATLLGGAWREDLVITSADAPVDNVDVRLVELFTSVLDPRGRAVSGLVAEDFTVRENGAPQTLVRFDTVSNLAINVALMMDVSASMRRKVAVAAESARRFFETVLRPQDRAALVTFNHRLRRAVPFSDDVERLRYGTLGLRPHGTTRLHDGLVFAAHAFGGLDGKRALVVLSDGRDVDSTYSFEHVLEAVVRAGVAVYPILLDLADETTEADLSRLAEETGGRFFAIERIEELDRVYDQIEEDLRAQYVLVYRPPPSAERNEFRLVEVTVSPGDPGDDRGKGRSDRGPLRARTIHGYYP